MKKFIVLLLAALCLLPGCSSQAAGVPDDVLIASGYFAYKPLSNEIYSCKDGVAADSVRLTAEEMLRQTAEFAPIATPFTVDLSSALYSGVYSVYDAEGAELYRNYMEFQEPTTPGTYLCVIEVSFGNERNYTGYQLFFPFVVPDNSDQVIHQNSDQSEQ